MCDLKDIDYASSMDIELTRNTLQAVQAICRKQKLGKKLLELTLVVDFI